VEVITTSFAPTGELPVVVTARLANVHSPELPAVGAVVTVMVKTRPEGAATDEVEFGAVRVGVPLQVSWTGNVKTIVEPLVKLSAGRLCGSVIEIGLTAVVVDAPSVTAGVFATSLNHTTLASVGTVKLVDARPNVE
jgi:hypothetical protein